MTALINKLGSKDRLFGLTTFLTEGAAATFALEKADPDHPTILREARLKEQNHLIPF